jgi:hypothetical protein
MSASNFVVLPGLTLPIAPVLLALDLESRGCQLERDGDDILVGPRALLSDEDRTAIKRWKRHLIAIIGYCEREAIQ